MTGILNPEGLVFIIVVFIAVCGVLSLGPAARAGDKINAMVNAAKYEHDGDGEPQ